MGGSCSGQACPSPQAPAHHPWHSWQEGILASTPLLYFLVVQIFHEAAGTPNKKRGLT